MDPPNRRMLVFGWVTASGLKEVQPMSSGAAVRKVN